MNATITVSYGGQTRVIELDGTEISEVEQANGSIHRYMTNASKDFIADEVETALKIMTKEV